MGVLGRRGSGEGWVGGGGVTRLYLASVDCTFVSKAGVGTDHGPANTNPYLFFSSKHKILSV